MTRQTTNYYILPFSLSLLDPCWSSDHVNPLVEIRAAHMSLAGLPELQQVMRAAPGWSPGDTVLYLRLCSSPGGDLSSPGTATNAVINTYAAKLTEPLSLNDSIKNTTFFTEVKALLSSVLKWVSKASVIFIQTRIITCTNCSNNILKVHAAVILPESGRVLYLERW